MPNQMKEVKVYFHPSDLDRINAAAQQLNTTRGQFIRQATLKSLSSNPAIAFDRHTFSKAVEAAAQAVSGIPRSQLEHAVAKVINTIASQP